MKLARMGSSSTVMFFTIVNGLYHKNTKGNSRIIKSKKWDKN